MNKNSSALLLTLFGVACGGSDPSRLRSPATTTEAELFATES